MDPVKVFIVEDDLVTSKVLVESLQKEGNFEVIPFYNGKDFLENIHESPDLISLDYYLPDINGAELFKRIRKLNPGIPVVIVSGQQDVGTAVDMLHKGAYDYVVKDRNMKSRLANIARKIEEKRRLERKIDELEEEVGKKYLEHNPIKGNSPVMHKVYELIGKAARSNITVMISGETGTGKELVAKAIHYNSLRRKGKFVAFNVSAIPRDLIESELFGHEKGAFTGANTRRIGKFEDADGGTLLLDEIGDMDLNMQVKLLRALQEEEFSRIGANESVRFDARIIVATNKNRAEEVKTGKFRADLLYRLMGLPIELPPLRDRGNDILLLAKNFLDEFSDKNRMPRKSLSPEAQHKLMSYHYPGNVRELKALMELASVLSTADTIHPADINMEIKTDEKKFNVFDDRTLDEYIEEIVKTYLVRYKGNVKVVAEVLNVGKTTIYRMLKKNPALAALVNR